MQSWGNLIFNLSPSFIKNLSRYNKLVSEVAMKKSIYTCFTLLTSIHVMLHRIDSVALRKVICILVHLCWCQWTVSTLHVSRARPSKDMRYLLWMWADIDRCLGIEQMRLLGQYCFFLLNSNLIPSIFNFLIITFQIYQ